MIAHLNTALPAARVLLLGASALALSAPLAANEIQAGSGSDSAGKRRLISAAMSAASSRGAGIVCCDTKAAASPSSGRARPRS